MDLNFKFESKGALTLSGVGAFWNKNYKYFLFLLLIVAGVFGGYIWKKTLFEGQWTEEKKQEYLSSQTKSVVLREADFKKALEDFDSRKKEKTIESSNAKDFFKPY